MKQNEIRKLYDREYSTLYNNSFLTGDDFRECTEYEVSLIKKLLQNAKNWLDVACGTGYILSRFPDAERAGLDISPAMLETACKSNPNIPLYEHDFREERQEWINNWDLISCMWYAYCYADSVTEVQQVIKNFASWTSPQGALFLPVCNPNILCKTKIPFEPPPDSNDGRLFITAITWTWVDEPSGRQHINLVAPTLEYLAKLLSKYFTDVKLVQYPRFERDCLESRKAFIARHKIIQT